MHWLMYFARHPDAGASHTAQANRHEGHVNFKTPNPARHRLKTSRPAPMPISRLEIFNCHNISWECSTRLKQMDFITLSRAAAPSSHVLPKLPLKRP